MLNKTVHRHNIIQFAQKAHTQNHLSNNHNNNQKHPNLVLDSGNVK